MAFLSCFIIAWILCRYLLPVSCCSPKPSPDFIEDLLPDMDTKSEILSEEHLRTVSWYWLYMYNLHVPPACRMIRLRVEDDRHLYPSLCMTVRSELTRSALVTRCDISIVTGLAIYIWNEGSFDNIMFRVIAFLEVQVRVFPEIVSEMHTWLVLKHVRNSIYNL